MEEKMIYVPYKDFVKGIEALDRLEALRDLIVNGRGYASDEVYAILGMGRKDKNVADGSK